MSNHFLLTNRMIYTDKDGVERVKQDGKEPASDLFRIAQWNGQDFDVIADTPPNMPVSYTDKIDSDTDLRRFTGSKRLFYELYRTMAFDEGGDVLLYIHGFNNDMAAVKEAMTELIKLYVTPPECSVKQIVIFSWPAENDIKYRTDFRDAKVSGYALSRAVMKYGRFLDEFFSPREVPLNAPCGNRLHLMCHSMGNFVFESMLAELIANKWSRSIFNQVILTAADVAYDVFEDHQSFSRLAEYCSRADVYYNNNDKALFTSSTTKNPATRLGSNGPRLAAQVPNSVVLVDATDVAPVGVSWLEKIQGHSYHLNTPAVIKDMRQVLSGVHSEQIEPREYIAHKNAYRIRH